jgi:lipoprotein signal peptidase
MTAASRSYRGIFWTLALLGLSLDLATKYAVFAWLEPREERAVIPGWFILVHHPELNKGALIGIGSSLGDTANLVFAAISAAAVVVIIGWSFRPSLASDWRLCTALGLILAGAAGNLYDRVVFGGVRDFMQIFYEKANGDRIHLTAIFNVADFCLVCGACCLLLQTFLTRPVQEPVAISPEAKAG